MRYSAVQDLKHKRILQRIAESDLFITYHAQTRYRSYISDSRPFPEIRNELTALLRENKFRWNPKYQLIEANGVTWGCVLKERLLILSTCFGNADIDFIRLRKWRKQNGFHDKVDFQRLSK